LLKVGNRFALVNRTAGALAGATSCHSCGCRPAIRRRRNIQLVTAPFTAPQKAERFGKLHDRNTESIVVREFGAPPVAGRPA